MRVATVATVANSIAKRQAPKSTPRHRVDHRRKEVETYVEVNQQRMTRVTTSRATETFESVRPLDSLGVWIVRTIRTAITATVTSRAKEPRTIDRVRRIVSESL